MEPFPSPHTAIRIAQVFKGVLQQWNIPKTKIFRILTDNGSNMVASFKPKYTNHSDDDSSSEEDFDNLHRQEDTENIGNQDFSESESY